MGTRAQVIIKTNEDYVKYYHHWDGDIGHLGMYLTSQLYVTYWKYPWWGYNADYTIKKFIENLDSLPEFEKEDEWCTHVDAEYLYYIKPHLVDNEEIYDVFYCKLSYTGDLLMDPVSKAFRERGIKAAIMEDKFKDLLETTVERGSI